MSRFLIILGLTIIIIGIFFPLFQKLGLGKLPGDFLISKDNFKFYFPLTTSILISCFLTLALWLINKLLLKE
jgi:hypothetical protein